MNLPAVITPENFETIQRVAKAMVASGYFQDARDLAQAVVKIMAGQELGLPPFASMTGLHIIKGQPAIGANLIATLIKNDARYDYRVTALDDTKCSIQFFEHGQPVGVSTFTAADAQRAGTQNMGKFPRNMLFARAMSNGAKWFTPGVFGGSPVYTPEELGATVDEEGNVIEGEVVQPPAAISAPATWEDIAPAAPANGNGKQSNGKRSERHFVMAPDGSAREAHEIAPTTTSAADYRAWLETQPGPTVPMSLIAQGAVRLGWYDSPDEVYNELKANPLIKQHGIICAAETRVKPVSAVMLQD